MSIEGAWQGEYRFEEGACDKEAADMGGHIVGFTMEIQSGWLGSISGTMQDDARTGFSEAGKLKGKAKGKYVEFRRAVAVYRMIHEAGRPTLEQWAERRKIVIDSDRTAPAMLFEGTLTDDGQAYEGTWKMHGETLQVPGSYLQFPVPTVGGTWRMRRKA
jgi:hypothetical protein